MTDTKRNLFGNINDLISGALAGGIGTILLHPLDVMKTRFQAGTPQTSDNIFSHSGYRSLRNGIAVTLKTEGIPAFYKGLSPALLGSGVSWGLYFFFYERAKSRYFRYRNNVPLTPFYHLISAWEAGTLCVFITNPIWLVKTRLQLQGSGVHMGEKSKYKGILSAFQTIIREEGFLGLYKGCIPALILVSHGAIQFMLYEDIKKALLKLYPIDKDRGGTIQHMIAGGTSKVLASTITYPYQVIKTRLQQVGADVLYTGTWDCCKKTYSLEGVRGFYRGLVPNLLKVAPSSALTFVLYEGIQSTLKKNI